MATCDKFTDVVIQAWLAEQHQKLSDSVKIAQMEIEELISELEPPA